MKNWKLVTVTAAALSALVFAAACTVEEGEVDEAGGAAGTGGTSAAGTGGTSAAGAAGADAGGAAGAAASSYADALPEACGACIKAKCATENTACGDVGVAGAGKCATFVSCLETETAKPDIKDYNCAYEACNSANPIDEVNTASVCTAKNCAADCFVTEGFTCN